MRSCFLAFLQQNCPKMLHFTKTTSWSSSRLERSRESAGRLFSILGTQGSFSKQAARGAQEAAKGSLKGKTLRNLSKKTPRKPRSKLPALWASATRRARISSRSSSLGCPPAAERRTSFVSGNPPEIDGRSSGFRKEKRKQKEEKKEEEKKRKRVDVKALGWAVGNMELFEHDANEKGGFGGYFMARAHGAHFRKNTRLAHEKSNARHNEYLPPERAHMRSAIRRQPENCCSQKHGNNM